MLAFFLFFGVFSPSSFSVFLAIVIVHVFIVKNPIVEYYIILMKKKNIPFTFVSVERYFYHVGMRFPRALKEMTSRMVMASMIMKISFGI